MNPEDGSPSTRAANPSHVPSPGAPTTAATATPTDTSSGPASDDTPLVLGWWLPPQLPNQQGRKPQLVVTISADTLRGIDDLPGELKRCGAIPADLAREIARQAGKVTVIYIGETGDRQGSNQQAREQRAHDRNADIQPAHGSGDPAQGSGDPAQGSGDPAHGPGDQANCTETSRRYKPRQSVIDQVVGRFQTCVHPGCGRDAAQCDVDHAIPFAKGGKSCPCNLVPLCRAHHRLKTHGGWAMRLTRPDEPYPAGSIEWRSRLGQRRIELPEPLPGEPDRATRDRIRREAWQQELRRVDPGVRPAPAVPDDYWGKPPF
ncbi:HNH endonuclease signature motif containing protein [Kineosporia mesophila]|uniref:HNH endonuclease signature motif containing protein n=1 Tax=Kineosporia mesophila TaxID=566012 RepID=UPI001E648A84|nr:HNH endonuclease signature motif containing protein [Kineosporia mesophila]MCD5352405.1 HNH endonuclease [Kineosporia mesophila]